MSDAGYNIEDCQIIIGYYQQAPRNKVSFNLLRQYSNEEMLYDFRAAFAKYTFDEVEANAPTNKQFTPLSKIRVKGSIGKII